MAQNSTQLSYPAGYSPATLTIEASSSGSSIYATASLNCGGSYWSGYSGCVLSIEIDGYQVGSISPNFSGHNQSQTVSGQRSVSDGSHTITAIWTKNNSVQYICNSGSVSTSIHISTASKSTFSIGKTTLELGGNLPITIANHGASPSSFKWSLLGTTGNVGMLSSGNWNLPSDFETLMRNVTTAQVTLTLTTSGYGSDTKTFTLNVPNNYVPTLNIIDIKKLNTQYDYLIANQSSIEIEYKAEPYPNDNTAPVTVSVKSYNTNPNIGNIDFTVSNEKIISSILPNSSIYSGYDLSIVLKATDTRGRSVERAINPIEIGRVYSYIPPFVTIRNLYRCDVNGHQSNGGNYVCVDTQIVNEGILTENKVYIDDHQWDFVQTSDNQYKCIAGGDLDVGQQYEVIVSVKNQTMDTYGDTPITIKSLLSTMQLPISFYDDGITVGVSVGEMANDHGDTSYKPFLNFARELMLRASDEDGNVIVQNAYDLLVNGTCPFPVGSIYLSLSNANPSEIWRGTYWESLDDGRFLISAGYEYEVGSLGGESSHTLTVNELPTHTHSFTDWNQQAEDALTTHEYGSHSTVNNRWGSYQTGAIGGNQPHNNIPPYLAVYMWKRINDTTEFEFTVQGIGTYDYEYGMNWNTFISSNYNPTLSGSNKRFKAQIFDNNNVVFVGEIKNNTVIYERYLSIGGVPIRAEKFVSNQNYVPKDIVNWDLIDDHEYDEIDFVYTTDVHGCWKGYQDSGRATTNFAYNHNTYKAVKQYKETLEQSNIKVLVVDGGDYTHYSGSGRLINNSYGLDAVNQMNAVGYFAVTIGNHEYKAGENGDYGTAIINNVLKKFNGGTNECSIVACNLYSKATNSLVFKPYKTAKIGSKKLAVIGIAFPGFDGNTSEWNSLYRIVDGVELYNLVQSYINELRSKGINCISVLIHLGKDGDDSGRCSASILNLISNTSGLSMVFPSHSHSATDGGVNYNDKDGNPVHLVAQPRCDMQYISRVRITQSGISSNRLSTY